MENIKNINIKEFLLKQGIIPHKEHSSYGMYLSPLRDETHPSFKVDYNLNLWYDFGAGYGGSIIDLVMYMNNCDFKEAIKELKDKSNFLFHCNSSPEKSFEDKILVEIESIKSLSNNYLINYLKHRRHIDINIAEAYCKEIHFNINNKSLFAVGFKSDVGGWELRNEYFKGSSSPKGITTIGSNNFTCLIFEGFIDMLSYLTLKNSIHPKYDIVVLNSIHNLRKAKEFICDHQEIHCFLDNDNSGKSTLKEVNKLGKKTIDKSYLYKDYKDINEFLVNGNRLSEAKSRVKMKIL